MAEEVTHCQTDDLEENGVVHARHRTGAETGAHTGPVQVQAQQGLSPESGE